MKNVGTLVGAPIRVNDSLDTYPSAIDNEIKGGRMSMATTADRDAIPAARRSAGMECYVIADGNTYELANDLVTWNLSSSSTGGGTTLPGSGGTSQIIQLISGNFGAWTALSGLSASIVNPDYTPSFKTDLSAFPAKAITYIQGQFGLDASFAGTTITLGNLPAQNRPANKIIKYCIFQNVEMFLVIETNGDVKLESKDGINLPTTSGTPEVQPYYIEVYFKPVITTVTPTTYTHTRTENFTRNNCGTGHTGSVVSYSQTYSSTIDQATADNLAATDPNYETNGQAYANANGTCSVDTTYNTYVSNGRSAGYQEVIFTDGNGTHYTMGGTPPGAIGSLYLDPAQTYTVEIINQAGPDMHAQVNGGSTATILAGAIQDFAGPYTPSITVTLTD